MTPELKAKELVEKFYDETPNEAWFNEPIGISKSYNARELAKQCALIAVDEILENEPKQIFTSIQYRAVLVENSRIEFWQSVKEEIQKL